MEDEFKITLTATNKREWPTSTLKSLNSFRQSEHTLCDVFILGDDSSATIPAHRCVLAANSMYFHAMFTSGLAESRRDHREVRIQGVERETLSLIIDFLYVGSCHLKRGGVQCLMDLLAASTMLQVDELSHACSVSLERCLDSNNVLELLLFAERYGLTDLLEPCKRFVQTYFRHVRKSDQLLELDAQEMATVTSLDEINAGNKGGAEDLVVEALLRWLEHDPKMRIHSLSQAGNNICWNLVGAKTKDRFRDRVGELYESFSADSVTNREVPAILQDVDSSRSSSHLSERHFFCSVCVIGGLQNSRAGRWAPQTNSIEITDVDTRTGLPIRHWAKPRGFHSQSNSSHHYHFLPFQGHLYAFFCKDKSGLALPSVIHPHHNSKSETVCLSTANIINGNLKSLRSTSRDTDSVWWDLIDKYNYVRAADDEAGLVYLCGCAEQREGMSTKRIFKLDIMKDECSELASLPFARSHHRAIVANGELFVFGGVDWRLTPLSTVLRYSSIDNSWEEVRPMHHPRIDGAFICVDGRIYATGGSTSKVRSREVEVYNPSLDIWMPLHAMSVPRVNHGLVAVGKFLFALGGQSYSGENGGARNVQRTVERYSIPEDRWESAWEMNECRWGMTTFTL